MSAQTDDEKAVLGAVVTDPGRWLPICTDIVTPIDFESESRRWLYQALVAAWSTTEGDFRPGPAYRELIWASYSRRFAVPPEIGAAWLDELEGHDYGNEPTFRWHCERLAARGAVRRVREVIGRWYVAVSEAALAPGVIEVTAKDVQPQDARDLLAGLLRDVRAAVKGAAVMPERAGSGPEPTRERTPDGVDG